MLRTRLSLLVLLPSLAVATGCAGSSDPGSAPPPSPATQQPEPLTKVDWSSFTYPSSCFSGEAGRDEPVRVTDYKATGPDGYLEMKVAPPVFGDVNGDGTADASITYRCVGANSSSDTLLVYVATDAGPRLVDALLGDQEVYVDSLRPTGSGLVVKGLGYTASAPHCCPDLEVRLDYQWQDGKLVLADRTTTPHQP